MPRINADTIAEHREQTLAALLDAVEELAAERSLDELPLRDIAAHAGVARTAVYNYAADKAVLLAMAVERATAEIRTAVTVAARQDGRSAAQRLTALIQAMMTDFVPGSRRVFLAQALNRALSTDVREQSVAPLRGGLRELLEQLVRDGMQEGVFDEALDAGLVAELTAGVLEVSVQRCVQHPEQAERWRRQTHTFITRGLHGSPRA